MEATPATTVWGLILLLLPSGFYGSLLLFYVNSHDALSFLFSSKGFPGGSPGKEPACNVGDLGLIARLGRSSGEGNHCPLQIDPWVGKILWRRERLPTPVFWLGEFHGLNSPWGCKESDTTERLSLHLSLIGG